MLSAAARVFPDLLAVSAVALAFIMNSETNLRSLTYQNLTVLSLAAVTTIFPLNANAQELIVASWACILNILDGLLTLISNKLPSKVPTASV